MVLKKGAFTAAMGDQVEFQMEVGRQKRKIGAPSMPKACFDEGEHGFHPHIIIFTLINLFLSRPLTAQFSDRGAPPPSVFPLLATRFYGLSVPRPFLSSFGLSILRPQCAPTFSFLF